MRIRPLTGGCPLSSCPPPFLRSALDYRTERPQWGIGEHTTPLKAVPINAQPPADTRTSAKNPVLRDDENDSDTNLQITPPPRWKSRAHGCWHLINYALNIYNGMDAPKASSGGRRMGTVEFGEGRSVKLLLSTFRNLHSVLSEKKKRSPKTGKVK